MSQQPGKQGRRSQSGGTDDDDEGGTAKWMETYADCITLLMVFFVLLFIMSEMDQVDPVEVENVMRERIGQPARIKAPSTNKVQSFKAQTLRPKPTAAETRSFQGSEAAVEAVEEGLKIQIKEQLMFEQGEFKLRDDPQLRETLTGIVDFLEGSNNRVEIRGFASPMEADTLDGTIEFRSEREDVRWQEQYSTLERGKRLLGYLRAESVYQYLIEKVPVETQNDESEKEPRLDPRRLRVSSEGGNNPIYEGKKEELIARNRRVEIIVLEELMAEERRKEYRAGD